MEIEQQVNILLVDDRPENLMATEVILSDLGQRLVRASSGREALRFLLHEDAAVILLDIQMPDMDGFELAEAIRARERSQHTPIIFITAFHKSEQSVFQGYSIGAVDYITKPFEPEILRSKVRVFIDLYRQKLEIERQAEMLAQANRELDGLNARLEARVLERTAELQAANFGLENEIAVRKRMEERLRKRTEQIIHYQAVLLELAKMDNSDPDSTLKRITEVDSKTLGVERVSVWFFNEDQSEAICKDMYKLSSGIHENGLGFKTKDYPRYLDALEQGRTISANYAQTDPRTSEFTEEYLKPFGIISMMDVAVRVHGRVVGIVCHEHTKSWREWTVEEQDFAASIADMVSLSLETEERRRAEEALRKAYDELEIRVQERTVELAGTVEKLHAEILERKRAEGMLYESQERYRTLFNQSPVGVYVFDKDFRIIECNERFVNIMQSSYGKIIGLDVRSLNDTVCTQGMEKAYMGQVYYNEFFFESTTGSAKLWLSARFSPIRDESGSIIGGINIVEDITERKKLEEERLKVSKLESVGVLAGGIAHDFNNMLSAMLSTVSVARMDARMGTDLYNNLTEAEKVCLQARGLTQQLLTFSRGGAPIKKLCSITGAIKDSALFVLRGSNVSCEFSIEDGLWDVEADQGQIGQAISNLVINAQQAMPQGGVIKISAENMNDVGASPTTSSGIKLAHIKEGRYVKIAVEDRGIGIPKEHIGRIFDPYFTTKQKGSGLGLATTYSIIKNHDGYIGVESETAIGTKFHVYIPASEKRAEEKKVVQEKVGGETRRRVLIMDDEAIIRSAAGRALMRIGYEVEYAKDGAETIEIYTRAREQNRAFDVVIMDLTIPGGMGGREAISRLIDIDPNVRAVVSSGYSNDPLMSDYKTYGFRGVVSKPYSIEELAQTLHKVMDGE